MTTYVFVDGDACIDVEIYVQASSEQAARRIAWLKLTDSQRDACGSLECVDEID